MHLLRILVVVAAALAIAGCRGNTADEVPAQPESIQLVDVAGEVGLDFEHSAFEWGVSADPAAMMGAGLCWIDYDQDGWLDLFLTNTWSDGEWGQWNSTDGIPTGALYQNVAGAFTEVTEAAGLDVEIRATGCLAADLDLDGYTDLYVTSDRANVLFWNNGNGAFTEAGREVGVSYDGWHSGAAAGDLNGDGWPELFVAGYADVNNPIVGATTGFPNTFQPVRDLLFLNEGPAEGGGVTFREVGEALELDMTDNPGGHEYGLGVLLADLDVDGDLDLYVANDTNPNRLYENEPFAGGTAGDPLGIGFRLREATEAGVSDDNSGMGVAGGDYTGDGRLDLVVTNLGSQVHSVYANAGGADLDFLDATPAIGVPDLGGAYTGWGVSFGDLDNDTDVDVVIANGAVPVLDFAADAQPMQVFANMTADGSPAQLAEIGSDVGLDELGPLMGRGSALADFDNDGDLDVAVNSIGSPVVLLENRGTTGTWLIVELDGFQPGAVVTVTLADGSQQTRVARLGSSYLSSEDPRLHFGLGDATRVQELRVTWPDGRETVVTDLDVNRIERVARPNAG